MRTLIIKEIKDAIQELEEPSITNYNLQNSIVQ
jgi:hypothetical protein